MVWAMIRLLLPTLNTAPVWRRTHSNTTELWPVEALLFSLLLEDAARNDVALAVHMAFTLRIPMMVQRVELIESFGRELHYRVVGDREMFSMINLQRNALRNDLLPTCWLDILDRPYNDRSLYSRVITQTVIRTTVRFLRGLLEAPHGCGY